MPDQLGPTGNTDPVCAWCLHTHHAVEDCFTTDLRMEIKRLREELKPWYPSCTWRCDTDGDTYETSCEKAWMFDEGDCRDNGVAYCPFCGGAVVEEVSREPEL